VTPGEWARLKEWFSAALDAGPEQAAAILQEAEEESPELAAELRSLLQEHDSPRWSTMMAAGMVAGRDPNVEAAPPPERLGPYHILRELGRGGSGVVYLAERSDDEFHRLVALKLLRYVARDPASEQLLTLERRALSQLQHHNIATLVDWGSTPEEVPWLAVEYVAGIPIDQYCREHDLSLPQLLAIFEQVCQAVQYAHRHLIVHSDLKPANILVTGDGLVKLLDFGIAQLLARECLLEQKDEPGVAGPRFTPAYAAPEQIARQPITAATDVYALGLLLYELLTGSPPHAGGTLEEMVRSILEAPPPPPSEALRAGLGRIGRADAARIRAIRGDLDRVVLHALAKDPEGRYPSVGQFLTDVNSCRTNFPISLRRNNPVYVARKYLRRHALAAGAVVFAVLALLTATTAAISRARTARHQEQMAEQHFQNMQSLVHAAIFDVHDSIRHVPGTVGARRTLVSTALKYLDSLEAEHVQDDSLSMELAGGYFRMGYVQAGVSNQSLGDTQGARKSYQTALRILDNQWQRRFPGGRPGDPQTRDDPQLTQIEVLRSAVAYNLSMCLNDPADGAAMALRYTADAGNWLQREPQSTAALQAAGILHQAAGKMLRNGGDLAGAMRQLERSADLLQRLVTTSAATPATLMVSSTVDRPQALHDLARTFAARALVLADMAQPQQASAAYEEFRRTEQQALGAAPADLSFRSGMAFSHDGRSAVMLQLGRVDAALAEARAGVESVLSVSAGDEADSSGQRYLSQMHRRLGNALCARRDFRGCTAELNIAADSIAAVAAKDPGYFQNRVLQAATLNDYAAGLRRAGRAEEAAMAVQTALQIAEESPAWAELRQIKNKKAKGKNKK
jgi:serine/threonine protein kinase